MMMNHIDLECDDEINRCDATSEINISSITMPGNYAFNVGIGQARPMTHRAPSSPRLARFERKLRGQNQSMPYFDLSNRNKGRTG